MTKKLKKYIELYILETNGNIDFNKWLKNNENRLKGEKYNKHIINKVKYYQ